MIDGACKVFNGAAACGDEPVGDSVPAGHKDGEVRDFGSAGRVDGLAS